LFLRRYPGKFAGITPCNKPRAFFSRGRQRRLSSVIAARAVEIFPTARKG